jgi:uncharacterized membrane protein
MNQRVVRAQLNLKPTGAVIVANRSSWNKSFAARSKVVMMSSNGNESGVQIASSRDESIRVSKTLMNVGSIPK